MLVRLITLVLFAVIISNSNFVALNAQIDAPLRKVANTEENISEGEIREFFRGIEATCNKMDAISYVLTLSEDFKMVGVINNKKISFSRAECLKNLSYGWSLNKDYNYKFEILNIQLKGTEAVVEGRENENITLKTGETVSGESIHKITLEKKNGQIKQKFIEAVVTEIR